MYLRFIWDFELVMVEKQESSNLHVWLFVAAFMCLSFSFILSTTSLSLTHERMPDRSNSPLPDVFFDLVPAMDWALNVSEIIIMLSTNVTMIIILSHRHRYDEGRLICGDL